MSVERAPRLQRLSSAMGWSVAALLGGAFLVGACADSIDVGETMDAGTPDTATSGPTFVATEAGADGETKVEALQCATSNCAAGFGTCLDSKFTCDVDLNTNNNHCGSCDVSCPNGGQVLNARSICTNGQCVMSCNAGYADCNGIPDDGCEQVLDDPNNCGTCGHKCAADQPCIDIAPYVTIGKCGCPDGKTWCGSGCVDLSSNDKNCGTCGNACPPPPADAPALGDHMHYGCVSGECANPKCDDPSQFPPRGYANCNGDVGDGCEANVFADDKNCGTCGHVCPDGQTCAILSPNNVVGCACPAGLTKCTSDSNPGVASCVDILNDVENCGACGARCEGNEGVICDNGMCVQLCPDGYADCNGDPSDYCETNIMTDPYHCGGCTSECDHGLPQPCQGGKCQTEDCDGGTTVQ